jgi:tRNA-specific 2-thiouridylase
MQSQATKNGSSKGKKVYIGLSGGVDSSVSATLLVNAGFDVTGVFIKVWQPDWIECTWREDRRDAMRICAKLGIPFVTLDLEKEYKKEVIDYMIGEYKLGRTPNPDVMCNKYIKFGGFFDWAMKNGADYVATGHYARISNLKSEIPNLKSNKNTFYDLDSSNGHRSLSVLKMGVDSNKDQTYFLWTLDQTQLSRTLFPIGHLEKSEVRKLAKKFDLPTAIKKDSQGLCFIGKIDIKDFLSHYIEPKNGNVLNEKGNVIGHHEGAEFLTIGERHGFTITKKSPNDAPYFIISKDINSNTVTVSNKKTDGSLSSARQEVVLEKVNWNLGSIEVGKALKARSRYRETLQDIVFTSQNTAKFTVPQSTLSTGQSLVVYDGDVCLGGGIIC